MSENGFMVVMLTKVLVLLLVPLVARFLVIVTTDALVYDAAKSYTKSSRAKTA